MKFTEFHKPAVARSYLITSLFDDLMSASARKKAVALILEESAERAGNDSPAATAADSRRTNPPMM